MKTNLFSVFILGSIISAPAFADDYLSYDEIIRNLDQGRVSAPINRDEDMLDRVRIHTSVGMVGTYVNVAPASGKAFTGLLQGFEASFGIDLFDPSWVTEFGMRSFSEAELNDKQTTLSLREFDLKVVYQPMLTSSLRLRVGAGVAARYLNYDDRLDSKSRKEYVTPASILETGIMAKLTQMLSLGIDLAYRNRLIGDTIDQSALDSTIKADINF